MSRDNPSGTTETFQPYIPASAHPRELTVRAVVVGTILGVIFGASSLYLVLKVGLTVSASIPVAVISVALFRLWSKVPGARDATILENNIVQTTGSAGESIAFGIGVTMPAIMILGFDLEIARVTLVALLGGLLGILMMIPLRRALIVAEHGKLKYPEGTACAAVLKAGASAESRALSAEAKDTRKSSAPSGTAIFTGFGIGLLYKTAMSAFRLWKDSPEKVFGPPLKGGSVAAEISPELLGVGYIIGPRIACIMMAGSVLSYLVLIPLIKFFGDSVVGIVAPGTKPISEMGPGDIRGAYVLYIGAGAVAAGGIISLFRSLPTILHGIRSGLADFKKAAAAHTSVLRTERDISMKVVAAGVVGLIIAILFAPTLHMNLLGAIFIVIFGFLFVTVSSRLTGEIGSSSNPISGMTVATLLLTCLIFLIVGWTGGIYYVTALSVGGIVCIAASNGGTTSQDLKAGFLVGATPRFQQISILIGASISALLLGPILLVLNDTATVHVPAAKVAQELRVPVAELASMPKEFYPDTNSFIAKVGGFFNVTKPATEAPKLYHVWQKTNDVGAPAGRYLVDETGVAAWLVDPGINGTHKTRVDGTEVRKFEAPKATLVSYIIKGILDRKLPWALVLFGVMIAVMLELCGISSLAFAVGVYVSISSSAPIFIGGIIRWLVDRHIRKKLAAQKLSEDELVAEGDKSPGVLLASGYIAGGAIAGIIIAFIAAVMTGVDARIVAWAKSNPFYGGPHADVLALIPFAVITGLLYLVGRGMLMKGKAH